MNGGAYRNILLHPTRHSFTIAVAATLALSVALVCVVVVAPAQTSDPGPVASSPTAPTPEGRGSINSTVTAIWASIVKEAGLLAASAASVIFAALWTVVRERAKRLRALLASLQEPPPVPANHKRNSVMIIGLAGSGKTSLIRALTDDLNANPRMSTRTYSIYSIAFDTPGENPTNRTTLYLSDYAGQNLGNLVRSFLEQQQVPYSPMRYGYVSSLILVVDLFEPPRLADETSAKRANYNNDRVRQHLSMWNEQALGYRPGT
jgi:ethanolamine/propanediol utilization PduV/EutP family protein